MPIDGRCRGETDPTHGAAVNVTYPERRLPLPQVRHFEVCCARHTPDCELDLRGEAHVTRPLGAPASERDRRMVRDVEEIGAAEVSVSNGLPRPDLLRVDHALEGGLERPIPFEFEFA